MKIIFLLIFILPLNLFASEWTQVDHLEYPPQNLSARVVSLSCPDSNNCYAFVMQTSDYLIKHSTDQGESWETIYTADPWNEELPIMVNLEMSCSPYKDYLFLSLFERPILKKSTDGGKTFERIILDTLDTKKSRKIYSLAMHDTILGYASSSDFYYITQDGWKTFNKFKHKTTDIYYDTYLRPFFMNANTLGGIYYGSSDEHRQYQEPIFMKYYIFGDEWSEVFQFPKDTVEGSYNQYLGDLCFIDDSLGFACGSQRTGVGDSQYEILFQTKNAGKTWDKTWKQLGSEQFGLIEIDFYNAKNGIAVGKYGSLLYTRDGGESWLRDTLPKPEGNPYGALMLNVTWAGQTPIVGTFGGGGLWRYEGDFFDFSVEDTTNPDVITEEFSNVGVRVRNSERSMYISIDDEQFRKYELKIYDINGNSIQINEYQSGSGNVFRPVNIEGLKSGGYLYMVSCDGLPVRSGKFVVVR
jgi:hypothetical protein